MNLKKFIREIPDYPTKGISFKDITTLLKDKNAFQVVVDEISNYFKEKQITKVVSLESRGFIVGGAVAYCLHAGFVPARKKGKLPVETIHESYELEYGTDTIEMHLDALNEDDVVLIHDDLLATGGTALAALKLVRQMNVKQIYFSFICDLKFIENGNKEILSNYEMHSLVEY
ncbi:adenine phosphoribosyltransferase [Gaoshiqia sediminis]|uniref:Adenine phosphoribosyltransferase n=1 Tax=Gaoshiqia sediminis TaxID=2986998 RepID=A0AA41Y4P5_9BACT|nr:adenine phosphoribosyltransferase [Gaoshiqia sediminis]MCW0481466.1 adenine phosphoribosyltransferase [Gaoshiqia sediminis]